MYFFDKKFMTECYVMPVPCCQSSGRYHSLLAVSTLLSCLVANIAACLISLCGSNLCPSLERGQNYMDLCLESTEANPLPPSYSTAAGLG